MKKSCFIILLLFLIRPFFAEAQIQLDLSSKKSSERKTKSTPAPYKTINKKKILSFFNEIDLIGKFSFHEEFPHSNSYTRDSVTFQDFGPGIPWPFLHYKAYSSAEISTSITGRVYFANKHLFIETGLEWINWHGGLEKVDGSHVSYNYGQLALDSSYNHALWASVNNLRRTSNELQIPIIIGIKYKFLSFSVGTYRGLYFWFNQKFTPDIGYNVSFHGFETKPYSGGRPLNPMVNLSATIINRKFKLAPFVSYRFSELFIGTEIGWNFKKA